jgi:hypothetical protein
MVVVEDQTNNIAINQFRYEKLDTPVTLMANTDYAAGALYSEQRSEDDDFRVSNAHDFMTIPQITYGQPLDTPGGTLEPPANFRNTARGFFGPNFTIASVPEPSSAALFWRRSAGTESFPQAPSQTGGSWRLRPRSEAVSPSGG